MPRKPKDLRRKRKGWQAYVRVNGELRTKTYALDHPRTDIRAWLAAQRKDSTRLRSTGSFAADVAAFLAKPQIAAQPYAHQTAYYLALWMDALGRSRPRCTFERDEIEAVIQKWLKKFAEPTVYHRRSALLSLFTVLDGAGAANPVKETTCPKSWIPGDHSVPFEKLAAIVKAMPDWCYPKKGIRRQSIAKLVGRVLIDVGMRPVDLQKIKRQDINWTTPALRWPASAKGQGTPAKWIPLTPEGLEALRAFDAADAYGGFSPEAVSHSFKRAARRMDGPDTTVHLYTGRHSIGADLYRSTKDLATVGRMLNHAPGSRATAQYAQGANADVDRAAAAALAAARQVQPAAQKLPKKLPSRRKQQKMRNIR